MRLYFENMTSCAWYEYITIATASLWNLRDINSSCQPRLSFNVCVAYSNTPALEPLIVFARRDIGIERVHQVHRLHFPPAVMFSWRVNSDRSTDFLKIPQLGKKKW